MMEKKKNSNISRKANYITVQEWELQYHFGCHSYLVVAFFHRILLIHMHVHHV